MEFRSMLRIVSVATQFKALISLDIFISYLSQIMAIFDVKNFLKNAQSALFYRFRTN